MNVIALAVSLVRRRGSRGISPPGVQAIADLFHPGGHMLPGFPKIARVIATLGAIELAAGFMLAQTTNPLAGSWNFAVTLTGGCTANCKYIGMLAFNQGGTVIEQRGTTVEYYGLGYVERTALGTWRSTGTSVYRFRMKNFVFDSTGKVSAFIVGISDMTLSATLNVFSGSGTA